MLPVHHVYGGLFVSCSLKISMEITVLFENCAVSPKMCFDFIPNHYVLLACLLYVGHDHMLAIADYKVVAWGNNDYNQTDPQSGPYFFDAGTGLAVAAGAFHSVALTVDNSA
jgi:hypothetical protein